MADFLGAAYTQAGALAGMSGVTPVDRVDDAFSARVRAVDPAALELIFASHAYDAVIVSALAAGARSFTQREPS